MMLINRRSLVSGLIGLVAAPAIVRASSIMPVKAAGFLYNQPNGSVLYDYVNGRFLVQYDGTPQYVLERPDDPLTPIRLENIRPISDHLRALLFGAGGPYLKLARSIESVAHY